MTVSPSTSTMVARLLRHIVLASLPALVGAAGCSGGEGGGDGPDCGVCGCIDPPRPQVVPYKGSCDAGGSLDAPASDASDGGDTGEAGPTCADPDKAPLNCAYQCPPASSFGIPPSCRVLPSDGGERMVECTYRIPC